MLYLSQNATAMSKLAIWQGCNIGACVISPIKPHRPFHIDFSQNIAMILVSAFILKWKTLQVKVGFCGNLNIYKRMSTGRIWGLCVWIWVFMRREGVGYLQNRWETNPALFRLLLLPLVKILTRIHICLMIEDTRVFWFLALLQDHPSCSRLNCGNSQ